MTTFSLENRTALVTGGSRGIGAAIVALFAERGARVGYCHYDDHTNAEALSARLAADGYAVSHTACDVSHAEDVDALALWASGTLGHVDILVNCAGIAGDVSFDDITIELFDRMIGVHLRGTFMVTKKFYPAMVARGWGRIINFSSQLAYKGAPDLSHYCAAKAGIVGFTRALAYEAAPKGITVNSIAPGPIETEMLRGLSDSWRAMKQAQLPLGRFGTVDEIAPTVLLLASEEGAYYVGQTLSPNGGDVMI
ncbi:MULTISPECIES: 3-oxoacyl-ACP reductase family protein [Agrobacterium]|uniref:3-oxoacyl-[acyl-carrier protein] reductase n=1 Tax=Agrobacterium larrymoorei TaxID=160699 RepID=A0AAJ2B6X9_9HYPH|nr:3-oxoacyl-ACP reductase family protein [Agrobacterium larrymoorei]MDQ1195057.1 3-oxoacyl-[acyl-carrier protein] reductase [Rhizobium sp. SORGH_AS_0787]MDR6100439.1 3-oxoacyl-[acyl-carrier protein] reductase [Agrobacterium larrymoorei]